MRFVGGLNLGAGRLGAIRRMVAAPFQHLSLARRPMAICLRRGRRAGGGWVVSQFEMRRCLTSMARHPSAWHHIPMKREIAYLSVFGSLVVVSAMSAIGSVLRGSLGMAALAALCCILSAVCVGLLLGLVLRKPHA
ncbi:hypothetical protein [Phenylobacterium sp.]|jgi:hypothetical protein|uniref:hypothetical protein n=1 Tax=Phenylobacterium sp. TaxID=1871053 RepID=UPI002D770B30|nr:hypothetical protein [Phenylobacterium sp.]